MPIPFLGDRKLFEQLPQAALLLDLQGYILAANAQACRLLRLEEQALLGRHADEATGFSVLAESCPLEEVVRQAKGLRSLEFEGEGEGAGLPLVVELTPLLDEDGRCLALLESFREAPVIHEMSTRLQRKQEILQAEMERSRALVNSIADGIYTVDTSMRITGFSRSLERITGFAEEEVLGARCRDVLQTSVCETDCPLRWTLENEKPIQNCRALLASRVGGNIPAFISSDLLRDADGNISGCIGIVRDRSEVEKLKKRLGDSLTFSDFVGKSKSMVELFELAENVASTDTTVLIQGESGTGKEIMARMIHYRSERSNKPFVRVNCAALTDSLLESELFGHDKGAFTGAIRDKPGRFELADGGTLFLDEIGDTSVALQSKLLRAVQEREFERVGGVKTLKTDVRVIAATNKDLRKEVALGRFREDLYYRLCVVPLHLPPLRERKEDIPLLVEFFIDKFNARGERIQEITTRAMALMMEYDWPGNVRELENAVEHAYVTSTSGRIERRFLPIQMKGDVLKAANVADEVEGDGRHELLQALERCRWQKNAAAQELGISRTTLWRRMKDAGLI
jgi:PAS domain S-box-containing protein